MPYFKSQTCVTSGVFQLSLSDEKTRKTLILERCQLGVRETQVSARIWESGLEDSIYFLPQE